ncbi:MAG: hypothetical protein PHV45_05060 [Desulfuromonas thiophila]|jgi:hypothetical protein|nr:hypothetical protein [Desulfuromonas thiophila]MDD3801552.1 hypothetical protein [Desulfuromonas thiophila]
MRAVPCCQQPPNAKPFRLRQAPQTPDNIRWQYQQKQQLNARAEDQQARLRFHSTGTAKGQEGPPLQGLNKWFLWFLKRR